jgi:hypothetical protein
MKCPQGCTHPAGAMRVKTETYRLPTPEVIDTPTGKEVIKYRTERFLECRVCGWCVDI